LTNIIVRRCSEFTTDPWKAEIPSSSGLGKGVAKKRLAGNVRGRDEGEMAGLARAVTVRLEEGNFRGAVRLLASEDALASPTAETLQALREKHPLAPLDRRSSAPPDPLRIQMSFNETAVRKALQSFPPGSSGGCDGMTPQHIKDMVTIEGQTSPLLGAITSLTNMIVAGEVPELVRPYFFGGRLIALSKKDGGVRPIVVGQSLRRLASKLVNSYATEILSSTFSPIQLGVGITGGAEAAVHAARRYVEHLDPDFVIVKLDFRNAFNTIRRDTMRPSLLHSRRSVHTLICPIPPLLT